MTYDLRLISLPDEHYARGRLDVVLLCSIEQATDDQAYNRVSEGEVEGKVRETEE